VSGVVAQATSDFVPYDFLAGTCLATLVILRSRIRTLGLAKPAATQDPG
jgi:hypothetical protein